MNNQDFTATISVDQTPKEAFDAINDVRGWWSEEIEGGTDKLGDEFTHHYKDVHRWVMTLAELANVAAFMASDKASGMTGTTVNLTMGSLDD